MSYSKFRNIKTAVDGIIFDSGKEANQYCQLKLLERAGKIRDLVLQPSFPVWINGINCFVYRGDFGFTEVETNERVVMDCKGFKTPMYRLKKKCVEAYYGFKVRET